MLKITDRFVLREVLPVLVAATAFYTAVFLFGFFYVGSRWLSGVPLGLILKWLAYHVPGTLVQVMPMAAVTATVVPFGRLASEGAVLAFLAGGVPLFRLGLPLFVIGALLSGVTLWLNEYVAPKTNEKVRVIWWEEMHTKGRGLVRLKGMNIPLGGGLELYFKDYDRKTDEMVGIRLQKWQGKEATIVFAERGTFREDEVKLKGYELYRVDYGAIPELKRAEGEEALKAVKKVFKGAMVPKDKDALLTIKTGLTRGEAIARFADPLAADTYSLTKAYRLSKDPTLPEAERREAALIFHSKLALPLANLVLIVLALPLAVRYAKTPGLSLGLSVVVALAFYLTFLFFRSLGGVGLLPPAVAVWTPEIVFLWLGLRGLKG